MRFIKSYFKTLSKHQLSQFQQLFDLYGAKNQQVNVISRKDIHHLYLHHVLHSLSIAKKFRFKDGCRILDLGTGGGFPGIPLAIYFPNCHFTMIDGTQKKIRVVNEVIQSLGLTNAKAKAIRAEQHRGKYDYVVSRAVAKLPVLWDWSKALLNKRGPDSGLIALKGGDISEEVNSLHKGLTTDIIFINSLFSEEYFEEKFIIHIHPRLTK